MKVYVFYYSDGDGYPSADKVFKTKEAAETYHKEHPMGSFGKTWYKELDLDLESDLMLNLDLDE